MIEVQHRYGIGLEHTIQQLLSLGIIEHRLYLIALTTLVANDCQLRIDHQLGLIKTVI